MRAPYRVFGGLLFGMCLALGNRTYADPFLIGAFNYSDSGLPTGGYHYSLFHTDMCDDAQCGEVEGWMALDDTWLGSDLLDGTDSGKAYYDPETGDIQFKVLLFDGDWGTGPGGQPQIGTAIGRGTGLVAALFNDGLDTGDVVGSIDWEVDAFAGYSLARVLGGVGVHEFTTHYVDREYTCCEGTLGDRANQAHIDGNGNVIEVVLRGAKGDIAAINATANGSFLTDAEYAAASGSRQVGTELVFQIGGKPFSVTPEPSAVALLCTGLAGIVGYSWNRRRG